MKKQLFVLAAIVVLGTSCSSQDMPENQVPSVVLNTLKAKYPTGTNVDWEKHNQFYEAELDLNDSVEVKLRIDAAGKLIMEKRDASVQELPAAVQTTIQQQYKDYRIDDVDRIEKDGTVYYQVELDHDGKKDVKRVFSSAGQEEKSLAYWD